MLPHCITLKCLERLAKIFVSFGMGTFLYERPSFVVIDGGCLRFFSISIMMSRSKSQE